MVIENQHKSFPGVSNQFLFHCVPANIKSVDNENARNGIRHDHTALNNEKKKLDDYER